MFLSENIPVLFKKGTLKLQKDGAETKRVAEALFVIEPFPVELARELGEEAAAHLYTDDGSLRDELESIDLRIRAGLQRVTVRPHADLKPVAVLAPVSIKDCSASRQEDEKMGRAWLAFQFVLVFDLAEKATRNFVIEQFGNMLVLSFESLQMELEGLAQVKEAGARLVGGGIDSVTISTAEQSVTLTKDDAKRLKNEAADLRGKRAH